MKKARREKLERALFGPIVLKCQACKSDLLLKFTKTALELWCVKHEEKLMDIEYGPLETMIAKTDPMKWKAHVAKMFKEYDELLKDLQKLAKKS
jgi:hypothetical protein